MINSAQIIIIFHRGEKATGYALIGDFIIHYKNTFYIQKLQHKGPVPAINTIVSAEKITSLKEGGHTDRNKLFLNFKVSKLVDHQRTATFIQ